MFDIKYLLPNNFLSISVLVLIYLITFDVQRDLNFITKYYVTKL